jgi:hypothetical protein
VASGKQNTPSSLATSHWPLPTIVAKITDFGLAKRLDVDAGQTQSGAILGTPSYMAPEQAMGKKDIGPPADVYALGALLYEMLTGQPPFKGPSLADTIMSLLTDEPRPVRQLQAAVPRDLETICAKCLAKEPSDRYASATELAADLGRFLNDDPIRARPAGLWERSRKWMRRRPAAALGWLVALLLVAGAAGGYLVWQHFAELRRARELRTEYYAHQANRRGLTVGIDPVTPEQARHRNLTYRFSVRGGRVEQFEVVTGYGQRTGRHFLRAVLAAGDPAVLQRRECLYRYRYDAQGNLLEEDACDAAGRTVWKLHFTSPTMAYFTDERGFPRPRAGSGAAYIRYVWDEHGRPRETWYLDRAGQVRPDRNGVYGERREFDEAGHVTRLTYLDLQGRPRVSKDRTAGWRATYDENGNRVSTAFVAGAGRPTVNDKGIHRIATDYNKNGNVTSESYFGLRGKLVTLPEGMARVTQEFDERGNQIKEAVFGLDGRPVLHRAAGYHMAQLDRDESGNPIRVSLFGTRKEAILNKQGFHLAKMEYDRRGNWLTIACFDDRHQPTWHRQGFHRWTRTYDEQSNCTERAYFGVNGKLAPVLAGCPMMKMKYDSRGNCIETAFCLADGQAALQKDGYQRMKQKYDDRDNEIEISFFGQSGRPVESKGGYQRRTRGYDELGYLNTETYFDRQGKAVVPLPIGYHRWTARLDENGNRTEETFFGADGKAMLYENAYHKRKMGYDPRSNIVAEAFFDREDRPIAVHGGARWTRQYDDENQIIDVAAFDVRNKPVPLEVTVTQVEPHGQAERLRLRKGDVLLVYDGRPVLNRYRLFQQRRAERPGSPPRKLVVRRQKKTFTVWLSRDPPGCRVNERPAPVK